MGTCRSVDTQKAGGDLAVADFCEAAEREVRRLAGALGTSSDFGRVLAFPRIYDTSPLTLGRVSANLAAVASWNQTGRSAEHPNLLDRPPKSTALGDGRNRELGCTRLRRVRYRRCGCGDRD